MSKPISFTKTEQTINKDIIPAIARVIKDVLTRVAVDDANVNEKVMFRNVNEKVMFRADCLTLMRILPRYKKLFYHLLINAPNTAQHGKPFPSLAYWHITHAATIENTLTEIVMKGSGHHEIWREGIKEIDHDFEVKFFKEHCDVMRKHSIFALDAMNCIGTYIDLKLVNGEKFKAIYKTLMKYLPEYKDVFDLLETFGLHGGLFVTSAYDIIHSPKGCEVIEMILSIALNTKQKWVKHSDGERILESFKFVRFIEHAEDTGKINPKEAAKKVMEKSKELKDDEETIKITSKENGICKDCDWKECPFVGTDLNPSICMKGSTFKEEKKEAKHACSGDCKCKTKTKDMYCCLCGCRKPTSDFIDLKFVTDVHVCKYCAQIISDNHA